MAEWWEIIRNVKIDAVTTSSDNPDVGSIVRVSVGITNNNSTTVDGIFLIVSVNDGQYYRYPDGIDGISLLSGETKQFSDIHEFTPTTAGTYRTCCNVQNATVKVCKTIYAGDKPIYYDWIYVHPEYIAGASVGGLLLLAVLYRALR